MDYLLALDQGTTSSRAIVFDARAGVCGEAQREFKQSFRAPVGSSMIRWRSGTLNSSAPARRSTSPMRGPQLRGIGITNQRETTVLWDRKSGHPLAPAIVWQDRRTAAHCEKLRRAGHEDSVRALTGLELDAYFSATKLAWLLDKLPGARNVPSVANSLSVRSTAGWCGNSAAVRSMSPIRATPRAPCCSTSTSSAGTTPCSSFRHSPPGVAGNRRHLGADRPHRALALRRADTDRRHRGRPAGGDLRAGLRVPGNGQEHLRDRLLSDPQYRLAGRGVAQPPAHYHRLASRIDDAVSARRKRFSAGAVVQWLRDGLGFIRTAAEVEELAASVPDNGQVVMVPAFTGLVHHIGIRMRAEP